MGKGFKFFDIEFQTETIVVVFLHGWNGIELLLTKHSSFETGKRKDCSVCIGFQEFFKGNQGQ